MRLLDHIAQCTEPFVVRQDYGELWHLTGPSDFAAAVTRCPLRYVLTDDLVRACVELAYSEGAGLSACLDLVRFPAEQLWIEWDPSVQREEIERMLPECPKAIPAADGRRHGVLISADATGRRGRFRTFWLPSTAPPEPLMAAVETFIDFSGASDISSPETLLQGGSIAVRDANSPQIDELLRCVSFRLNETWQRYYDAEARTGEQRAEVIRCSLGTVAFDAPMLIALFLLLGLRSEILHTPVSREPLNAKRVRLGKRPLLAHIEVSCPVLSSERRPETPDGPGVLRSAPRFHHVRGHIVRRQDAVYWRRSHWRGHLRLGSIQSRTVTLRLPSAHRHGDTKRL